MDNIDVRPGTGATKVSVATDDISGTHHPLYKIEFGVDGVATLVSAGNPLPVDMSNISSSNPLPVQQSSGLTAFGETSTESKTSIVNLQFAYNLHPDLVTERHNNGSASVANSLVTLSTGAVANQSAQIFSHIPIKYYTGVGGVVRFTTVYTAGVSGSTQLHGIGDAGDGYFFGYNGDSFGVLIRSGGNPEIRTITITTGSSTAENVTITLDGDADATVAVTSTGDVTLTANEIASHDYTGLGRGWTAIAEGDAVTFKALDATPRSGAYSMVATTAVGTFAQRLAGVAPTDTWTPQASWSDNVMTALDPTKGNVYQIRYQWLGFGQISYYIEDADTGSFVLVHRIKYANANTLPSVQNPTLPLCMMALNSSNTTDITMSSASMAGFIEGNQPDPLVSNIHIINKTFSSTTIIPAVTGHNTGIFQNRLNRVRIKITNISVEVESGKPVLIEILKGNTLTGSSYVAHDAATSVAQIDESATATTGGEILDAFTVTSLGEKTKFAGVYLEPSEFITIAGAQASSGTSSVTKMIINWTEDF